jgi:hypothetical protein
MTASANTNGRLAKKMLPPLLQHDQIALQLGQRVQLGGGDGAVIRRQPDHLALHGNAEALADDRFLDLGEIPAGGRIIGKEARLIHEHPSFWRSARISQPPAAGGIWQAESRFALVLFVAQEGPPLTRRLIQSCVRTRLAGYGAHVLP